MSIEFEINVGDMKEPEPTPEEKMAKEAEKKAKLEVLYSTLKKLVSGDSGLSGEELEMAKKQTVEAIAKCYEDKEY